MMPSHALSLPRLHLENLKLQRCLEVLREVDDAEIAKLVQAQKLLSQHAARLQLENQQLKAPCSACVEQQQARSLLEAQLGEQKQLWNKEHELRKKEEALRLEAKQRAENEITRLLQGRQQLLDQAAKAQAAGQQLHAPCPACAELRAAVGRLEARVQEQQEMLKSDEAVKQEAMKEIQALMSEVEQASASSTRSGGAVSGLEAQVAALTQQLAEARAKRLALVSEAASSEGELRGKLGKLQADFTQVAQVRDHLLGVVDRGKQEVQELAAQLRVALEERDKAQRINAKWNDKVQDLKEKKRKASQGKAEPEPEPGRPARPAKERPAAAAAAAQPQSLQTKPSPAKRAQAAAAGAYDPQLGNDVAPAAWDAQAAAARRPSDDWGGAAGPAQGSVPEQLRYQGGHAPRAAAGPTPPMQKEGAASAPPPQAEEGPAAADAAGQAAGGDVGLRFALQKHPAKKKASAKLSIKTAPTAAATPSPQQQQQQPAGSVQPHNPYLQPHFLQPPQLGARAPHMFPHQLQPPEVIPGMPGAWLHPPPHVHFMNLQQAGVMLPPLGPGAQHPWGMPVPAHLAQHGGLTDFASLQQRQLYEDWMGDADQSYASGSSGRAAGADTQGASRRRGAQAGDGEYAGGELDGQQRQGKRGRGDRRWEEEEEWEEEEWEGEPEPRQDRGRGPRRQGRHEEGEQEEGELRGSRGRGPGPSRARASDQRDRRGASPAGSRSPPREAREARRSARRQEYSSDGEEERDRRRSSRRGYSRRSPDRAMVNYGDI